MIKQKSRRMFFFCYVVLETAAWITVECGLYRRWQPIGGICMIPTVLSAIMALVMLLTRNGRVTRASLLLTCGIIGMAIADFFFCYLQNESGFRYAALIGFMLFSAVEIVFAVLIGLDRKIIIIRLAVFLCMIGLAVLLAMATPEYIVAVLNLSQLAVNLPLAWRIYHRKRTNMALFFALGVTFFFACDYGILAETVLPVSALVYRILDSFVWLWYVLCQIFFLASLYQQTKSENSGIDEL